MMGEESAQQGVEMREERLTGNHNPPPPPPPPHFVLIHGIGGGAWCWYKIKCLMENCGYRVSCLDLKGSGMDQTDPNTILTFEDYNQPLIDFLSSLPPNQQVILVGHSAGGLSVSDAIHRFGKKKIKLAVFVAATMLKSGFVTDEDVEDGVPEAFKSGPEKLKGACDVGFGLGEDHPPTTLLLKGEFLRKISCQLAPPEDCTLASMLGRPGPVQALTTARFAEGEGEGADEVPRIYIRTTQDNVVKPHQQEAMIRRWPPSDVYVLESDHNPAISAPFLLVGLLLRAAVYCGG